MGSTAEPPSPLRAQEHDMGPHLVHPVVHTLWTGVGAGGAPHGRKSPCQRQQPDGARVPCLPTGAGREPRHPLRTKEIGVAESYNGYCVKCKEKRDFEGEVKVSESGRRMAQGTCPVCGTKMNRILGKA